MSLILKFRSWKVWFCNPCKYIQYVYASGHFCYLNMTVVLFSDALACMYFVSFLYYCSFLLMQFYQSELTENNILECSLFYLCCFSLSSSIGGILNGKINVQMHMKCQDEIMEILHTPQTSAICRFTFQGMGPCAGRDLYCIWTTNAHLCVCVVMVPEVRISLTAKVSAYW